MPKRTKREKITEATLKDTELVLFSPLVEKAVRHYGMVEKDMRHACNDLIIKRRKLIEAAKKRPGE